MTGCMHSILCRWFALFGFGFCNEHICEASGRKRRLGFKGGMQDIAAHMKMLLHAGTQNLVAFRQTVPITS
jgi:hypothetical protein